MKQFVCRHTDAGELESVTVYGETDHIGAAAATDLAEIEGLRATIFLGEDLNDVVRSNEFFFSEAAA